MKKNKRILCIGIILIAIIGIIIYFFIKPTKPKYIFLFIGDGMSSAQVELTEIYENSIEYKEPINQEVLNFTNFESVSLRKNYSKDNYVPDSAASGTALASGLITYNGSINTDYDGSEKKPLTYDIKEKNKKIGIITTVPLNHATPAAFYAGAVHRGDYDNIAYDLVDSNFDYFAGGNFTLYNTSYNDIITYATNKGYNIIDTEEKLNNISKDNKNIVISPITIDGSLPFAIDNKTDFNLANYVKKAIETLDNKNGFFIMAESGLIDYAGHNNDARSVISEVQELENAVEVALQFAKKHPKETLIIVTGDHETGGLTLGQDANINVGNLQKQQYSYKKLIEYIAEIKNNNISYEEVTNYLNMYYGIQNVDVTAAYQKTLEGDNEILKSTILNLINKEAKINYSTTQHTADRIPVYATGVGCEKFTGIYNTSEFNKILRKLS